MYARDFQTLTQGTREQAQAKIDEMRDLERRNWDHLVAVMDLHPCPAKATRFATYGWAKADLDEATSIFLHRFFPHSMEEGRG